MDGTPTSEMGSMMNLMSLYVLDLVWSRRQVAISSELDIGRIPAEMSTATMSLSSLGPVKLHTPPGFSADFWTFQPTAASTSSGVTTLQGSSFVAVAVLGGS